MQRIREEALTPDSVRANATLLTGAAAESDTLIDSIGEARLVLIGEASHGTREFYHERAEITKRLIAEKGFSLVAVEADWPDAYRVNRFVRSAGSDEDVDTALSDFQRFPRWMWRNTEVAAFAVWLRQFNEAHPEADAGFYGLDLYSMYASVDAVLSYLDKVDPKLAEDARTRYACFEQFEREPQAYGYAVNYAQLESCEDNAVQQLMEMQRLSHFIRSRDGRALEDESFFAEQNARLVHNAETYYRAMYRSDVSSWNLRDRHMAETVDALLLHVENYRSRPKAVIWAHNSHLGDARATQMSLRGELNVGQLLRQRYGSDAFAIGFTTYSGTVTAAHDWDGEAERRQVRPALDDSFESLFHDTGMEKLLVMTNNLPPTWLLERAIGVIYRPETERSSHYFEAEIASQFDAVIHIDETTALEPLDVTSLWLRGEMP
jgi:erythromycin esterase-like protein